MVSALTIAIQHYQERIANAAMFLVREETEAQLRIAQHMLERLIGAPVWEA
jgi:hypothetical protein